MSTRTQTAPATNTNVANNVRVNLKEIEPGDIFYEQSHYIYIGKSGNGHQLKHLESGTVVNLDNNYVKDLLVCAEQYDKEVKVGKEDKHWTASQIATAVSKRELPADHDVREGDVRVKGIRTIWSEIYSEKVFTVCFNKQAKEVSARSIKQKKEQQAADAIAKITRRGATQTTIRAVIEELQNNPVLTEEPGEERILKGYKVQFSSVNGMYDVVDMSLAAPNNLRKVNVNEINWLVYDGIKYVVE